MKNANTAKVLEKLQGAEKKGSKVEFETEEAKTAGCFVEDAISEEDAIESIAGKEE